MLFLESYYFSHVRFREAIEIINKKFSIPIRPRVKINETYYYIGTTGKIETTTEQRTESDQKLYDFGNYFVDEHTAKKYQKKVEEKWNYYKKQQVNDLK